MIYQEALALNQVCVTLHSPTTFLKYFIFIQVNPDKGSKLFKEIETIFVWVAINYSSAKPPTISEHSRTLDLNSLANSRCKSFLKFFKTNYSSREKTKKVPLVLFVPAKLLIVEDSIRQEKKLDLVDIESWAAINLFAWFSRDNKTKLLESFCFLFKVY